MYPTSEAYKSGINQRGRNVDIKAHITLSDETTVNITKADIFGGVRLKEQCVSSGDIDIGSVYSSEFKIQIRTDEASPHIYEGARITPQSGIEVTPGNYEYIPLGVFYVIEPKRHTNGVQLIAADGMVLLEKDLTGVATSGTLPAIISSLCLRCDVTLATTDFTELTNTIDTFALPENSKVETCRDLLMWACQLLCGFARFNRAGQLEIIGVTGRTPVRDIPKSVRYKSEISDGYVKITSVSTIAEGARQEYGSSGMTMELNENPLLSGKSGAEISNALSNILSRVTLAEYTPCDIDFIGDASLQAGDFVTVSDTASGTITAYITHSTWTLRGNCKISGKGKSALVKKSFSQQGKAAAAIKKAVEENRQLATAAKQSAELLKDAMGGYVLKREHELLIMDDADPEQAVKIWRFNLAGLGYSENCTGADNPDREYRIAITMDGSIVGSFIGADSVLASAISQAFKNSITAEIDDKITEYNDQTFMVGFGQITSYIESVRENLEGEVGTLQSSVSELQLTADALNLAFSNTYKGGINLIHNSSGLNGLSDDWDYTGAVQVQPATGQTASGYCFRLASYASLKQTVENVQIGKPYTLTMKFRLDGYGTTTATIKLVHGEQEDILFSQMQVTEWTELSATITAAGADFQLIAQTSIGIVELFVADIMLVEGTTKASWTPAPNEIYTTNVKIDRHGINITNSESDTETVIDNTQFAVKHRGDTVITVNKDETQLKKSKVSDDLTIGKLKIQPKENPSDGVYLILLD